MCVCVFNERASHRDLHAEVKEHLAKLVLFFYHVGGRNRTLGHETWRQHLYLLSHLNSPSTGILMNRFLSPPSEFIVQGNDPDYQTPYPLHTQSTYCSLHLKQMHLDAGLALWLLFCFPPHAPLALSSPCRFN